MATPAGMGPSSDSAVFWKAVNELSEEDLLQLGTFAFWRLKALGDRATGLTPEDLLHEAMVRLADGTRTLPEQLKLKDALVGVMRSVANAWGQRAHHRLLTTMPTRRDGEALHTDEKCGVVSVTPERILSARERLECIHRALREDCLGLAIFKGWELGMKGPEIQRSAGASEREFRAAEKRVRRLISKLESSCA